MGMFRIHFTYEKKEIVLLAENLDMTHPYFVSIKNIELPKSSPLIIDPNRDSVEKQFGQAYHLMIPFQSVTLIEELPEEKHKASKHFSVVDRSSGDDENDEEQREP